MTEAYSHQALPPDTMVQEYRIVRVLGMGSFGIVYAAENKYFSETVAIKEFFPTAVVCRQANTRVVPLSAETEKTYTWALQNFLKEARILWKLAQPHPHRNIVCVRQFIEANDTAYMVMDFEEGRSLSYILKQRGVLPEEELKGMLLPLLDGIERVHAASIRHRDIKPSNILIRPDGSPVLIDFGAAHHEAPGSARSVMIVFSPAYAAPEQVGLSGEQGPWTDIYALGATFYRAAVGKKPTNATERLQGKAYMPASQAAEGRFTPDFLAAIDTALELDVSNRPQSIAEWRGIFEDAGGMTVEEDGGSTLLVTHESSFAKAPAQDAESGDTSLARKNPSGPPHPRIRRRWMMPVVLAAVALVIGLTAVFLARPPGPEKNARISKADGITSKHNVQPSTMSNAPQHSTIEVFTMGSTPQEIDAAVALCRQYLSECPREWYDTETLKEVQLSPFEIDATEVTNQQFARFVQATHYVTDAEKKGYSMHWNGRESARAPGFSWKTPDGPNSSYLDRLNYPVVHVSYNDAAAYCQWDGARLPAEAEWEYAARGKARRIFPWGNQWQSDRALWRSNALTHLLPVGSFPRGATPEGIHDMAGSVWEWTSSSSGSQKVLKGGSWLEKNPANLRASTSRYEDSDLSHDDDGFRCLRAINE
jgi:formylglycine-generating enzyme required for sulfatase activity